MPSHEAARSSWKIRHRSGHLLQVSWCWQRCSTSPDGCSEKGETCRMDGNSRASQMEQIKGLERLGGVIYIEG